MKHLLLGAIALFSMLTADAQSYTMKVTKTDGTVTSIAVKDILSIEFVDDDANVPKLLKGLTGRWMLIASNDGEEVAPGVWRAGTDTIYFSATPNADGISLSCHTDRLHWRKSTTYSADWQVIVEEKDGQRRLGWVLDATKPAWSNGNMHLYLLSEDATLTSYLGMTFWSPWSDTSATTYTLSNEENNARKVYGLLSTEIPFAEATGMIEIWSSPRFEKLP